MAVSNLNIVVALNPRADSFAPRGINLAALLSALLFFIISRKD